MNMPVQKKDANTFHISPPEIRRHPKHNFLFETVIYFLLVVTAGCFAVENRPERATLGEVDISMDLYVQSYFASALCGSVQSA